MDDSLVSEWKEFLSLIFGFELDFHIHLNLKTLIRF